MGSALREMDECEEFRMKIMSRIKIEIKIMGTSAILMARVEFR